MKLTAAQQSVIDYLKDGATINYFRGIGTKYTPSASLEDANGCRIKNISVATLKSLRKIPMTITEYDRESYHSKFKLFNNENI